MSTLRIVQPFWERPGPLLAYPGRVQVGPMCVFESIISATEHLTGVKLTVDQIRREFLQAGERDVNFASVLKYVRPHSPNLIVYELHDVDNPLTQPDEILAQVAAGAVLILSLQVARKDGDQWDRQPGWHMISVFKGIDDALQVWDTNDLAGRLDQSEVREILVGENWGMPYQGMGYLIPHDRHHCLILSTPSTTVERTGTNSIPAST